MTRRKSEFKKTLVLVLISCAFVQSRPQDSLTTSLSNAETTETPISSPFLINERYNLAQRENARTNRVIHKNFRVRQKGSETNKRKSQNNRIHSSSNNSKVKKIITKWIDSVTPESSPGEYYGVKEPDSFVHNYYTSTELIKDNQASDKIYSSYNYPQHDNSEETHIYTSNIHIIDKHPYNSATRPTFIFSTPTPTPIITNVGYPQPWPERFHNTLKPTTAKPIKYTKPSYNHNNYPQYPGNFEVTTFPPTQGYTDRIVIRPEEYAASSDDCPTIFLTLNNTFQGQAKEACPDLNIAVNTNVVNKNVVVESEEDTDTTLTDIFGFPNDNSESEEASHDYTEEDEENDSAPIESLELSNYNAANGVIEAESVENSNIALPSSPVSALSRPNKDSANDDGFGLSVIVDFFRPAISAFSWLASINPLSFPALSFILTPIILTVASTSGLAALFAPWVLSYARQAPDVDIFEPQWHWDNSHKIWNLHSQYSNRNWTPRNHAPAFVVTDSERKVKVAKKQTWLDREHQNGLDLEVKVTGQNTSTERSNKEEGSSSREVKNKTPVIKESIKIVADQLLEKPLNESVTPLVSDTRIPPKLKNQLVQNQKIRTRLEDAGELIEDSHIGVAVPVTMEELELENSLNQPSSSQSSTSKEGISTWILLNNPVSKENTTLSTEPTKVEDNKKSKPIKNKTKRPQSKPSLPKRPVIGSTNKSDLIASGSAINENVYNKIKDTVLSNVQKNKNIPSRTTIPSTTTAASTTIISVKKETATKEEISIPVVKVTSKPSKKKDKNKQKTTTTLAPITHESAMMPMEAKEQEIELEVSTPATTTKKPKRSSTKKKSKTKKRKSSKPKPIQTSVSTELKTANKTKTKTTKTSKKPTAVTGPFTSQIYNYFSREVMPSVGVGVIGLAGLVGIASYFLYPFATPVRRTFEVDKKDDIYRNNAEEYASEGNGQPEEEMLGTVLAGMPAHAKQKLNPYAAQTTFNNRYPVKKDPNQQDTRYRHVTKYDPNYNVHYSQQKTGIAHGAVYSEPINYHRRPQYETRHAYTTAYPAVEPIYAAPQTGPSEISAYGSDSSGSVVYGVKPSADTDFKPVYPYDNQFYGETTSSPVTYSPTSMYLGSNNESDERENIKYDEDSDTNSESGDNKFVVGNVPKELTDSETPAVVPEHGPRKLNRKRRSARSNRGIAIDEFLEAANKREKDVVLSNEIDDTLGYAPHIPESIESMAIKTESGENNEIIESVSTVPIVQTTENIVINDRTTVKTSSPDESKETSEKITTDIKSSTPVKLPTPETTSKPTNPLFPEILTYPPPSTGNGFFDFLQRLVEFKYRLGLSILQNTSKSLNRYLRSMEESIQKATVDASH
ncbi:unnamed protein product [Leptosia nina]|uniref:Uncharacterized protein n=1 Tax=Leptosia nina TaxID=320188 RepID=A0AAV1J4D2_9NEOP